jgi:hypothetical protein
MLDNQGVQPKPPGRSRLPFTFVGEREQQRRRKDGVELLREKNGGDVGLPEYANVLLKDICVLSGLPNALLSSSSSSSLPIASSRVAAVIAENARNQLAAFHPNNDLRRPLMTNLAIGLTPGEAVESLGISAKTLARGRKEQREGKQTILDSKYTAGTKKERRKAVEKEATKVWLHSRYPPKSGGRYHIQDETNETSYKAYRKAVEEGQLVWDISGKQRCKPRSRCVFDAIKKKETKIRVVTKYDGQFECLLCQALPEEKQLVITYEREWNEAKVQGDEEKMRERWIDLEAARRRAEKLEAHRDLRLHQRGYLEEVRWTLSKQDTSRLVVVMDFTKINMQKNVGTDDIEEIIDLVVVLEWWARPNEHHEGEESEEEAEREGEDDDRKKEEKDADLGEEESSPPQRARAPPLTTLGRQEKKQDELKQPQRRQRGPLKVGGRYVYNIDYMCAEAGAEGNDTGYVKEVLEQLLLTDIFDRFDRIDIFTDGGGKHFKNVYTMQAMARWLMERWVEVKKRPAPLFVWNVTAAYHGRGVADGHGGAISQSLDRERRNRLQQHLPIPKTPADIKEVIESKCANSSVVVLERIPRPAEGRVDLESLEGKIKSMYQFVFVSPQPAQAQANMHQGMNHAHSCSFMLIHAHSCGGVGQGQQWFAGCAIAGTQL